MLNNVLRNPPFYSFVSFLIVSVAPFNKILSFQINKLLLINIMYCFSNSSPLKLEQFSLCHSFLRLKLLKLLFQNHVFFLIASSITDAAAVIPNGAKIFLQVEQLLSLMDQLFYLTKSLKIVYPELFQIFEL